MSLAICKHYYQVKEQSVKWSNLIKIIGTGTYTNYTYHKKLRDAMKDRKEIMFAKLSSNSRST